MLVTGIVIAEIASIVLYMQSTDDSEKSPYSLKYLEVPCDLILRSPPNKSLPVGQVAVMLTRLMVERPGVRVDFWIKVVE